MTRSPRTPVTRTSPMSTKSDDAICLAKLLLDEAIPKRFADLSPGPAHRARVLDRAPTDTDPSAETTAWLIDLVSSRCVRPRACVTAASRRLRHEEELSVRLRAPARSLPASGVHLPVDSSRLITGEHRPRPVISRHVAREHSRR